MKATFSLASYDLLIFLGPSKLPIFYDLPAIMCVYETKSAIKHSMYIVPVPQRIILLGKATYRLHR